MQIVCCDASVEVVLHGTFNVDAVDKLLKSDTAAHLVRGPLSQVS